MSFFLTREGWEALPEWLRKGLQVEADGRLLWIRFRLDYLRKAPAGREGSPQAHPEDAGPLPDDHAAPAAPAPFGLHKFAMFMAPVRDAVISVWRVIQRVAPLILTAVLLLGARLAVALGMAVPPRPASTPRRTGPGPASSNGGDGEGGSGSRRRTRPMSRAPWWAVGWWPRRPSASVAATIKGARLAVGRAVEVVGEARRAIWEWLRRHIRSPPVK
jgi:hypothetical protein